MSAAVVLLYEPIGSGPNEVSAKEFAGRLQAIGDVTEFELHVNSQGGSVVEGIAIANLIAKHPASVKAVIDGGALSIASYIVMQCDTIEMAADAWLMIHNPMTAAQGDAKEFERLTGLLTKMKAQLVDAYAAKSGLPADEIEQMMENETWMTANEAIAFGFADSTTGEPIQAFATFDITAFRNVPEPVALAFNNNPTKDNKMPATVKEIKTACPGAAAEFILDQIEAETELNTVIRNYANVTAKSNSELTDELIALKVENEQLKMKLEAQETNAEPEEEEPEEAPDEEPMEEDMEEEEEKPEATGAKPVARARGNKSLSYTQQWMTAVAKYQGQTTNKLQALSMANRKHPGLRENYLKEINAAAGRRVY